MKPSFVSVEYAWICDKRKCAHVHKETHMKDPGQIIPRPLVPAGWNCINDRLYCDRHAVSVKVDGKLTTDCTPYEKPRSL